jgi:hypothetical protein
VYVEHRSPADDIGVGKVNAHVGEVSPFGATGDPIPVHQWSQRIWIFLAEPEYGSLGDHPHPFSLQTVNH